MPYVDDEGRRLFTYKGNRPSQPGDLTYLLTVICHKYIEANGKSYEKLNEVVGALENTKLEFARVVIAPYEDIKRNENGRVSEVEGR